MARHSIVEKLDKALKKEIVGEDQVVYILVEIRKLIDTESNQSRYMSLKLYCDWAVHTELTYASRTRPILTLVDQDIFDCFHPDGHGITPEENDWMVFVPILSTSYRPMASQRRWPRTTSSGSTFSNTTRTLPRVQE